MNRRGGRKHTNLPKSRQKQRRAPGREASTGRVDGTGGEEAATRPARTGRIDMRAALKRLGAQLMRDEPHERAAALAYRFFLALFPFSIFVTTLGAFIATALQVQDPAEELMALLGAAPTEISDLMRDQIEAVIGTQRPGLLSFGILGTLIVVTSGTNALIVAMNRAYGVEETRPTWKRYLLALGLTLLASTAVIGATIVLVAGQVWGQQIAGALGLEGIYEALVFYGRWPLVILLLLVAATFLYWAAPNIDLPWKWITPGAVLFTVGWLITTYLFSLYVANFGAYNVTYGALGGVAVLLVWFYMTALILLLGAELNAVIDEQLDPDYIEKERRETQDEAAQAARRDGDGDSGDSTTRADRPDHTADPSDRDAEHPRRSGRGGRGGRAA